MKGKVLGIDPQSGQIAITAVGGERFYCNADEWKGASAVMPGIEIDFEALPDKRAAGVFPIDLARVELGFASAAPPSVAATAKPAKSKTTTTLLAFFLGGLGGHHFYLGSWGWGVVSLLLCWTYIPAVVAIFDTVRFIIMKEDDFNKKYEQLAGGPFEIVI